MATRKKVAEEDKQDVTIGVRLVPAFAIVFDHHSLSGNYAVGLDPERALASARGLVASRFPDQRFNVTVSELNPETFERAGLHWDELQWPVPTIRQGD